MQSGRRAGWSTAGAKVPTSLSQLIRNLDLPTYPKFQWPNLIFHRKVVRKSTVLYMQKSQPYHAMLTPQILCAFNGALTHSMMIICALQQIDELANIGRQGEKGETGETFHKL